MTNHDGLATFSASSTVADEFTVTFGVDGLDATDAVTVNFLAGSPAAFTFLQQPTDTVEGEVISPAVVIQVVDDYGNWVENDNDTLAEVYLRQQGVGGQDFLTAATVNGGQVGFEGLVVNEPGENLFLRIQDADGALSSKDSDLFDVEPVPVPDSVSVDLSGFNEQYAQGSTDTGSERVEFTYDQGDGDIEQIFNVFRIYEDEVEVPPGTYDDLFVNVWFVGPGDHEDYIRGLSGTSEANVVAPETGDVAVMFQLEAGAPTGEYKLEITSYDVTPHAPEDVSLEDANNGVYAVLDSTYLDIEIYEHVP